MKKVIFLLLVTSNLVFSQTVLIGKVVAISDGDTFTLLDENKVQHKVRLAEIDAPENSQPFGKASKKYLSELIFSKTVKVIYTETDRYQRIIGKVYIGQMYISEEMIRTGNAWHFKRYSESKKLSYLEKEAQVNKRGLWSVPGAIAPWEWRKK